MKRVHRIKRIFRTKTAIPLPVTRYNRKESSGIFPDEFADRSFYKTMRPSLHISSFNYCFVKICVGVNVLCSSDGTSKYISLRINYYEVPVAFNYYTFVRALQQYYAAAHLSKVFNRASFNSCLSTVFKCRVPSV